jgi:hypothetical protein
MIITIPGFTVRRVYAIARRAGSFEGREGRAGQGSPRGGIRTTCQVAQRVLPDHLAIGPRFVYAARTSTATRWRACSNGASDN